MKYVKMKTKNKDYIIIHKNKCIDFCHHVVHKIVLGKHEPDSPEEVSRGCCSFFLFLVVMFLFAIFVAMPIGYIEHNYIETYNITDYNAVIIHDTENNFEHYFHTFMEKYFIEVIAGFLAIFFIFFILFICASFVFSLIVIPYKSCVKDYNKRLERLQDIETGSSLSD